MSHTEDITDEQVHEHVNEDELQKNVPTILREEHSDIPVPENLTAENVEKLPGLLTEEYAKRVSVRLDVEDVDRVPEPVTAEHVKKVSVQLNAEHVEHVEKVPEPLAEPLTEEHVKRVSLNLNAEHVGKVPEPLTETKVEKGPEHLIEEDVEKEPQNLVEEILKTETFEEQFAGEPEILHEENFEKVRVSLHEEQLETVPEQFSGVHLEKEPQLWTREYIDQVPAESTEEHFEILPFDPLDLLPHIVERKPLSEEISEEHLEEQLSELLNEDSELSGKIPDSATWEYDDLLEFEGEFPESEKSFHTDETEYDETRGETLTQKSEDKTRTAELHEELGEEREEWIRMAYENEIVRLVEDKRYLRYRNQYIHKKLSEYLKKKNLTKMFREPANLLEVDLNAKYEQVRLNSSLPPASSDLNLT